MNSNVDRSTHEFYLPCKLHVDEETAILLERLVTANSRGVAVRENDFDFGTTCFCTQ